ncbi:MAG: diguanylate cyclase [Gammaproteobacteria bacterium]|nr:diguanylate cyclase [Gammaproteobacteria bacterium]
MSFRTRLIAIAMLFVIGIGFLTLVTETQLQSLADNNHRNQLHQHQHRQALDQIFWALNGTHEAINRFSRDPSLPGGEALLLQVHALRSQIERLMIHDGATEEHPQMAQMVARLAGDQRHLQNTVQLLVETLNDPSKRFPAMNLMATEMFPLRRDINMAIALAIGLGSLTDPQQWHIREQFYRLQHNWEQVVIATRKFIANRSGVFGSAGTSMEQDFSDQRQYTQQIEARLARLQQEDERGNLNLQQSASLEQLIEQVARFDAAFLETAEIYRSTNWRMDEPLMSSEVEPAMARLWETLLLIDEHLNEEAVEGMQEAQKVAERTSLFLWLFLAVAALVSLSFIWVYNAIIRRPMMHVVSALDAMASGAENLQIPRARTDETARLIHAFQLMRRQVIARQQRLQSILDNTTDGIITIDDQGSIEVFNQAAERLFGFRSAEVVGKNVSLLMPEPDRSQHDAYIKRYLDSGEARVIGSEFERMACRKNGSLFPVSIKIATLVLDDKQFFTAITADISERRELIERLKHLAERDPLTGLYNRRYFTEELGRAQQRVKRGGSPIALLFIDLDNFKYVNDTLGHPAGDQVLLDVTGIFKERARAGDLIARLGGDEFAILLYDVAESETLRVAEDFRKRIADYVLEADGYRIDIGCSIGQAFIDEARLDLLDPIKQADIACHLAKKGGKNRIHQFQPEDAQQSQALDFELGWANRIRQALQHDQFRLHLHPVLEVKSGRVHRYQVEARLEDGAGGEIGKEQYGKPAERFDLMADIDRWTLEQAAARLQALRRTEANTRFAIRLSAQTASQPDALERIRDILERHQLPASAILFEFLEEDVVQNIAKIKLLTVELNALGHTISVVGIGLSSLRFGYLRQLPVELIRIDKEVIGNLGKDNYSALLVKFIIDAGHAFYKNVGAEGADTDRAVEMLIGFKADCLQGAAAHPLPHVAEGSTAPQAGASNRGSAILHRK